MIEANELRRGNLVYEWGVDYDAGGNKIADSSDKSIVKVESIGEDGINLFVEFGEIIPAVQFELMEGIRLTPEILSKCTNIEFYIQTSSGLTLTVKDGKLVWLDNEWDETTDVENVTCVHQFQNLYFALTGKELDIKL